MRDDTVLRENKILPFLYKIYKKENPSKLDFNTWLLEKELIRDPNRSVKKIIFYTILDFYNISENLFFKKSHKRESTIPRFSYFYFMKEFTGLSLAKIGSDIPQDHATVLNGLKRIDEFCETDIFFKAKIDEINIKITNQLKKN